MSRYHVVTFGCQMNQHDSERIAEVLERAGYVRSPDLPTADVVLLNTCSVREKAEQKLRSEVGRLGQLKRDKPNLLIAVAGCVAQQEGKQLLRGLPQIDVIVGPDQAGALPRLLSDAQRSGAAQICTEFDVDHPSFLAASPTPSSQRVSDFVTVMKGCDERCTFCVVPATRGPERYRPSSQVVEEVKRRVDAGAREITLLGQTVDSYLDPLGRLPKPPIKNLTPSRASLRLPRSRRDETEFPALLRCIARDVPELQRLRYTSPHPRHLTPSLVEAHRELDVLARHVHLPVQSGSDRVLKRMSRRYHVEEYLERSSSLRRAVPGLTLSTDVIVGFPGETERDFELTLKLVEQVAFIGVFGFKYSPRPRTPALKLGDDVSEPVKRERLARLFDLSERIRQRHLDSLVGSQQQVLVEKIGARGGYEGRTIRNEIVHVSASGDPTGQLMDVRIERAFKHSLAGAPLDPRWSGPQVLTRAGHRTLPVLHGESSARQR